MWNALSFDVRPGGAPARGKRVSKRKGPSRFFGKKTAGPWGGRFYFLTIAYGLWFLIGGIVGFARKRNYVCLGVSCSVGVLVLLIGFAHLIEYNRGVEIESYVVSLPLFTSFSLGIAMSVLYGISGDQVSFVPFGLVGTVCCVASAVYLFLFVRDFARNPHYKSRNTSSLDSSSRGSSYDPFLPGSRDPMFD